MFMQIICQAKKKNWKKNQIKKINNYKPKNLDFVI